MIEGSSQLYCLYHRPTPCLTLFNVCLCTHATEYTASPHWGQPSIVFSLSCSSVFYLPIAAIVFSYRSQISCESFHSASCRLESQLDTFLNLPSMHALSHGKVYQACMPECSCLSTHGHLPIADSLPIFHCLCGYTLDTPIHAFNQ